MKHRIDLLYKISSLLIGLTYVALAVYKISSPGVQYDELLFVNAALGAERPDQSFIRSEIAGIPVQLMLYIGALKSYLYYPIFKIFGVNVWSVRLPVIVLTFFSLLFLSSFLKDVFNKTTALLVVLLLSTDPSFIYFTRVDVGPNALEFFLKTVSIFLLFKYFKSPKNNSYLIVSLLVMAFGLFNKLNFIWFINGIYATLIIFNLKKVKEIFTIQFWKQKSLIILATAYFIFLVYFLSLFLQVNQNNPLQFNIIQKLHIININFGNLISGYSFLELIYGNYKLDFIQKIALSIYTLVIVLGIIIIFKWKREKQQHSNVYISSWIMFLLILIQILFTPKATAPWHVFALYPFYTILIGYSLYLISTLFKNRALLRTFIFILPLTFLMINQANVLRKHQNKLGQPTTRIAWSDKIYDLINYTKSSSGKFVSIDWGLHNNLIAFDPQKNKYKELSNLWGANEPEQTWKNWVSQNYLADTNTLFIAHANEREIFPNAKSRFENMVKSSGMEIHTLKSISDQKSIIYEIYSLRRIDTSNKP